MNKAVMMFALLGYGSVLMGISPSSSLLSVSQDPEGFVPMYSKQGGKGHQTALINAGQIVRITPVFDPTLVLEKTRKPKPEFLHVLLSTGEVLTVYEDYEDFKKRIRNSR